MINWLSKRVYNRLDAFTIAMTTVLINHEHYWYALGAAVIGLTISVSLELRAGRQ